MTVIIINVIVIIITVNFVPITTLVVVEFFDTTLLRPSLLCRHGQPGRLCDDDQVKDKQTR